MNQNLTFDKNDDRFDNISDISSEDEVKYDKDYKREYRYIKSRSSCNISEI